MTKNPLPLYCNGIVIEGFGRGSKQLGIPTANYSNDVISSLPEEVNTGVYYGWAQVNSGDVHKMVMSIGWNPYYKNVTKSMEVHIMHPFGQDFYGSNLKTCILAYIRPETDFSSLDELISTIKSDIALAEKMLDTKEFLKFKDSPFFREHKTNESTPAVISNGVAAEIMNGHGTSAHSIDM